MKTRGRLAIVAVALLMLGACASAAVINVAADSYVTGYGGSTGTNRSATNYGADTALKTRFNTGASAWTRKIYLRFDLSSITAPTIETAVLELYNTRTTTTTLKLSVYGLVESATGYGSGRLDEFWAEGNKNGSAGSAGEITYANAPGNVSDIGSNALDSSYVVHLLNYSKSHNLGDTVKLTSQAMIDFLNADTNNMVTFIILYNDTQTTEYSFASKEASTGHAPRLDITTIPEPATMTVLLLGACGALLRRR